MRVSNITPLSTPFLCSLSVSDVTVLSGRFVSVRGTAVRVSNITPLSTPFLCSLSVSDVCCQVGL